MHAKPRPSLFLGLLHGAGDFLLDLRAIDGIAVPVEGPLPRGDRVGWAILLESQVAEVLLDDGILWQLFSGPRQRRIGEIELALLDVRPAKTVEERRVVGLDAQGPLDQAHRLVELRACSANM